ncbi:MAG: Gfo/Idh/MocA family oxidoreductase [Proteobacteria bacterium]|nr:Gfo/Idh/MocA family oxidoreductase [Pseudomonadota bacterium]MBI3498418.1 Gfo/Idh/MocA family oxidoreductase [Pseudomonadota bacterium]
MSAAGKKRRAAIVGTGHRGFNMWGKGLVDGYGDFVELTGLCDQNRLRAEAVRAAIGGQTPVYTDFPQMMREQNPELVIVCTRDSDHDQYVVAALEAGADVITEKPMATTVEKCRRILDAETRTGRRVDVSFNYRYSPTATRIKEILRSGAIGEVTSVDFHWYLDTRHGADYFRRWHAKAAYSGTLFVHKATHHYDLLNWYLESDPAEVSAVASLRNYGKNGPFRGVRCRTCAHKSECRYFFDMSRDPLLEMLYEEPSHEDGYVRDACVFREDIDIYDTMTASIRYQNGAQISYSVNCYMPIEGYHLAFNGKGGRVEIRQYEAQPWKTPPADEILVMRNFGPVEHVWVPHSSGGHFGGDDRLRDMIFKPGGKDPLGQRAGARAGAVSVLCGLAAAESARTKKTVALADLWGGPLPK